MKRILVIATMLCMAAAAGAQLVPGDCAGGALYAVQNGNTPWQMFGPEWKALEAANPGIKARTFINDSGQEIVRWYPFRNDTICIPKGMQVSDEVAALMVPVPEPVVPVHESVTTLPPGLAKAAPVTTNHGKVWLGLGITFALLMLGVVFVVLWFLNRKAKEAQKRAEDDEAEALVANAILAREQELAQDPVTSGPPFVAGGIPPTEPERVESYMHDLAVQHFSALYPEVNTAFVRVEQIGPVEVGSVVGQGDIAYNYLDKGVQWQPRRIEEPGIDAYQATFRMPDNTELILQTLVGCMNPARTGVGEVMQGFTFRPRKALEPSVRAELPAAAYLPESSIIVRPEILVPADQFLLPEGLYAFNSHPVN